VSDYRPDEANGVIAAGRVDILEVSYSILDQRAARSLFPLAQQQQISIIARSPLASGALSGTWHDGMRFHKADWRQTVQRVSRLNSLVGPTESLVQLALRFCLSHPAVTAVIPGVRSVEQVVCNLAVLKQEPLLPETLDQITTLWQKEFYDNVRTSIGKEGEG
jgi:aryl-alcohol dehydrogenase-like predicted oxidoreductase